MRGPLLNLALALVWALLLGRVNLLNLVAGYVIGFALIAVFHTAAADRHYVSRVAAALGFVGYFLRELLVANAQVALFALMPRPPLHPVIVAVPLRLRRDGSITLLAAAITLLPGTVAMGVSADRRLLYAHAIGLRGDLDAARNSISRIEDRLLRFLE